MNYLQRAGGDLTGAAAVIRAGESIGRAAVDVESDPSDGKSRTVATGRAAYRLFR